MNLTNRYSKKVKISNILFKSIIVLILDFDVLLLLNLGVLENSEFIFSIIFHSIFTAIMLYNIVNGLNCKIIVNNNYIKVYTVSRFAREKIYIDNIDNIFFSNNALIKDNKFDLNSIVIDVIFCEKTIRFALDENDFKIFKDVAIKTFG